ncbi:hypothetical protein [Thiorhodovibrio winogradskyi]|uniref:hypothetical protein n=1 Tax=Thiorhodovibrio winogradskyi TaxID=77007 RepID=UPI002E2C5A7E|nr:hypothetical protein [Thiorhodovibrio winogradskyi]
MKRFIIVDDQSDLPLIDLNLGSDVYIFKPVIGNFKNFKAFWLQCLMRKYQVPGSLCLCVDSDEYLDIPKSIISVNADLQENPLDSLLKQSSSLSKYGYIPGLLIDLMPENELIQVTTQNFIDTMNYHAYVQGKVDEENEYKGHSSIKWAFGDYWETAYRYDLRYHVYRTFDCMRKFPVFIYSHDIELNQGFHSLARGFGISKLQNDEYILPIRHYKMIKVLVEGLRLNVDGYFDRTAENLSRIYNSSVNYTFYKWKNLEKRVYKAAYIKPSLHG